MKILVLSYEYPPLGGGGAPVCKQLSELFVRHGHEVDVITMGFKGLPRHENLNGIRITRVPALRKRQSTCQTHEMISYVVSAFPTVVKRLSNKDYDIIHVHFIIPTGLLAYLATRLSKVPFLITAHGSDIPGYNPDRFSIEHHFSSPLLRLISKNALGIVSPSLYLKDLIRETISECPIEHIPNGIDISRFTVGTKQKRILMTGRLLPRKGFQHILTALRGIDTDFEVHIAGDGPMLSRLRQIADTLDVDVTFHGWIANDSTLLKELYETSSIFCLPSERENGSISLLEAMLSGMAVITSNVSGCPETVGDTGLVVSPNDPGQLQQALVQLISSESLCRKLGSKARQRVEDLYNWEIIGTRYLDLFERINT